MTAAVLGTADRSLGPEECWALLEIVPESAQGPTRPAVAA